jgi:hypothetical protein
MPIKLEERDCKDYGALHHSSDTGQVIEIGSQTKEREVK